jgi:ABC-type phosphate/phosphonate transport system substrate-binding protein
MIGLSGERHMRRFLLSIALLAGVSGVAFGQTSPASEIAPGGKLRVGMIAITVLGGVAEPVARFIGQKLGAAVEPVMYPNPDAYLQSFGKGEWDIDTFQFGSHLKNPRLSSLKNHSGQEANHRGVALAMVRWRTMCLGSCLPPFL